jgi:DNA invertase Pin-like site-specific DNA recombinase
MRNLSASEGPVPVAQYNRMSGDHQDYSIPYQQEWNRTFAARHGMEIVATYADEGKSGLTLHRRVELQRLLTDVRSGNTCWKAILCYDITRWGRFQDPDESAFYEWACKTAGYPIIYTAESFDESGGLLGSLPKNLKRAMAGEYSRELSVKTYSGQKIGIMKGLWASGHPGYGLRRATADENGNPVKVLESGEWIPKNRHACVVLGPPNEVETVRRIFLMYVEERRSVAKIVAALNIESIPGPGNRRWCAGVIYTFLKNEKYTGTLVWGRRSVKFRTAPVRIPADQWIRVPKAFHAIIEKELFDRAQISIDRCSRPTDEEMLEGLRRLLKREGYLSFDLINAARDMPSITAYRRRFGNASDLYALIGCEPPQHRMSLRLVKRHAHRTALGDELIERLSVVGADVVRDLGGTRLTVNGSFVIGISVVYGRLEQGVRQRWVVSNRNALRDLTVVARMDPQLDRVIDYYFVPGTAFSHRRFLRVGQTRAVSPLAPYRRDDLTGIEQMVGCLSLPPAEDEIEGLDA